MRRTYQIIPRMIATPVMDPMATATAWELLRAGEGWEEAVDVAEAVCDGIVAVDGDEVGATDGVVPVPAAVTGREDGADDVVDADDGPGDSDPSDEELASPEKLVEVAGTVSVLCVGDTALVWAEQIL